MTDRFVWASCSPASWARPWTGPGHGYARWAEQVAATGYCPHPVRLAAGSTTPTRRRARSARSTRPTGSRTPPSSRPAEPACLGLPVVLGDLPGRQLPAPRRRPAGRQGHPRDGQRPSSAVRHLHRPRRSARSTAARPKGGWCSPSPLPAGQRCPHGRRVAVGSATTPTTRDWASRCVPAATRPAPRCCGTLLRAAVVPDHHLSIPGAGPARGVVGGRTPAAGTDLVCQGRRVPAAGRGPLPRHHPPGRPPTAAARLVTPPAAEFSAGAPRRTVRHAAGHRRVSSPAVDPDPGERLVYAGANSPTSESSLDLRRGRAAPEQVAGYLAKYATKATEAPGTPWIAASASQHGGVAPADPSGRAHRRLLGARAAPRWRGFGCLVHMLGFGGLFSTKSRRYSITLTEIRRCCSGCLRRLQEAFRRGSGRAG